MTRRIAPLLCLAALAIAASPAAAEVRRGEVSDPAHDTRFFEDRWMADITKVSAEYDEAAGRLSVTWTFSDEVPDWYSLDGGANFYATNDPTICAAGGSTSLHAAGLTGHYWHAAGYGSYLSATVFSDVLYPAAGIAVLDPTARKLTATVHISTLSYRHYGCVTDISLSEWNGSKTTVQDRTESLLLTAEAPSPDPSTVPGFVSIESAPTLDRTSGLGAGSRITATARYKNVGGKSLTVSQAVITARRPGVPHNGGSFDNFGGILRNRTIAPGETITQTSSLTLPGDAPTGTWEVYATWQDSAANWHDGPSGSFTVGSTAGGTGTTAPPPPTTTGGVAGEQVVSGPRARISRRPVSLRRRTATVRVTCPGASTRAYTGMLRLRTAGRVRMGSRKRVLELGSRRLGCDGGETLRVPVRLSAGNARIVRRLHRLRVRGTVLLRDEQGRVGRATTRFTLKGGG